MKVSGFSECIVTLYNAGKASQCDIKGMVKSLSLNTVHSHLRCLVVASLRRSPMPDQPNRNPVVDRDIKVSHTK